MEVLLKEIEAYGHLHEVPIIRDKSLSKLITLLQALQPCHILEIGTAIAYSTLHMAQVCPKAQIDSIEILPERYEKARYFVEQSGVSTIQLHLGDASDLLNELAGPFDFVFFDAAKGQYSRQLQQLKSKLSPKAVLVADNVLFRGYVLGAEPVPRRYRTIVKRLREYLALVNQGPFSTEIFAEEDGLAITFYNEVKG